MSGTARPRRRPAVGIGARLLPLAVLVLAGCSRPYVAPILPWPYREELDSPYDEVWRALVRLLAQENVQVRSIARDSGVIASEAVPTTIGLYADCGRFGGTRVEGDAQVAYTVFVEALSATRTAVQVNTRMRTEMYARRGGTPRARPALTCASTGRWEANLVDALRSLLRR